MGKQRQADEIHDAGGWLRPVVLVVGAEEAWPGVETVVCASADEAMVCLGGSRRWSAVLVEGVHADLEALASDLGVEVVVRPAGDLRAIRSADDLGRCGPALASLSTRSGDAGPGPGRLVAVCGPGGTGASTVAKGIATGLAGPAGGIVLADLALAAGQAVLHRVAPTDPGLEELVHAHRNRRLAPEEVRARTLATSGGGGYRLLVGLHRPSQWTAIRPLAFDAALDALRATFSVIVADVTGDLEGEEETGSIDIEERNHMARRVTALADLVVVVGADGPTGRRALDRIVEAVGRHTGDGSRTITVLNRLWNPLHPHPGSIGVGALPESGDLAGWARLITEAVGARLAADPPPRPFRRPTLVSPGSIGHWQRG